MKYTICFNKVKKKKVRFYKKVPAGNKEVWDSYSEANMVSNAQNKKDVAYGNMLLPSFEIGADVLSVMEPAPKEQRQATAECELLR